MHSLNSGRINGREYYSNSPTCRLKYHFPQSNFSTPWYSAGYFNASADRMAVTCISSFLMADGRRVNVPSLGGVSLPSASKSSGAAGGCYSMVLSLGVPHSEPLS